jgi:hypothetical protein
MPIEGKLEMAAWIGCLTGRSTNKSPITALRGTCRSWRRIPSGTRGREQRSRAEEGDCSAEALWQGQGRRLSATRSIDP